MVQLLVTVENFALVVGSYYKLVVHMHLINVTSSCVENNTISEECTTADKKTEELAIFSLHC